MATAVNKLRFEAALLIRRSVPCGAINPSIACVSESYREVALVGSTNGAEWARISHGSTVTHE